MKPGGVDIVFTCIGADVCMIRAVRMLEIFWPRCILSDPDSDNTWTSSHSVPFGKMRELFAYKSRELMEKWHELGAEPQLLGTMIHFLHNGEDQLTIVVDDPEDTETKKFLDSVRTMR